MVALNRQTHHCIYLCNLNCVRNQSHTSCKEFVRDKPRNPNRGLHKSTDVRNSIFITNFMWNQLTTSRFEFASTKFHFVHSHRFSCYPVVAWSATSLLHTPLSIQRAVKTCTLFITPGGCRATLWSRSASASPSPWGPSLAFPEWIHRPLIDL